MPRNCLFFLLFLLPTLTWGECSPDTVQFYLDKGFTQEQITKLCSHNNSASTPSYQPYQKPVVIYQDGYVPGVSSEERKAITELKGGIDGRSVDITDDRINYIRRVCVIAGNAPDEDKRAKKCIDVAFSIARNGLTVTESGRGLLVFGQQEIKVISSEVKRKTVVADPWAAFPPDLRFALERRYNATESGNETVIPLRKSTSTSQMVNALRTIAAATDTKKTNQNQSEVARVLDDSYIPPTEDEYTASQPAPEVVEKKKKKKRWWNPFD